MAGKGGARPGAGRPKGSIGHLAREFQELYKKAAKERGFNLAETLVEISADKSNPELQVKALAILAQYAYPKLKAQEMQITEPVRVLVIDATQPQEPDVDPLS